LLGELVELFGPQRPAAVARELTKLHETVYRGTLAELAAATRAKTEMARGEITLVVSGAPPEERGDSNANTAQLVRALKLLLAELPPPRAAAIAAQLTGFSRSEAYALAQRLRGSPAGESSSEDRD